MREFKHFQMVAPLVKNQVTPLVGHDDSTLPVGNSWSCQQNNANNAYNVVVPSGSVNNNNNKNNSFALVPIAESDKLNEMLFEAEKDCWKNKKKKFDAAKFHYNLKKVFELDFAIRNGTYKPGTSICFVLSYPRYREVFAAMYRDRVVHHLLAPFILQVTERVHEANGNISHGNRRKYSAQTAAEQIQENMKSYPNGVVATMDVSGFFMSIARQMTYDTFVQFCHEFRPVGYTEVEIKMMLKLLSILTMHDPTSDCIRNSPIEDWENVASNKTLFGNEGKGLPIGNFYSQLLANLVLAVWGKVILDSGLDCRITQFVDDMCVVAANAEIIKTVRKKSEEVLSDIGLTLHPTKYYIQPVSHGVAFCGRVIYPDRIYIGNRIVRACKNTIRKALKNVTLDNVYKLQRSFNSYIGFMCHCRSFNIQKQLSDIVMQSGYKKWLYFKISNNKAVCKIRDIYKPSTMALNQFNEITKKQKQYEDEYKAKHCTKQRPKTIDAN